MSTDKEEGEIDETQCVTTGTAEPNQLQDEGDVVSGKDGTPSDLTYSVSSSGDVTDGFTGPNVSETLPCCSSVPTSAGVQNETVNLSNSNRLNSTGTNGNLTRTLLKALADTKREIQMRNKAEHLHSNFKAASRPRASNQMGRFLSAPNPRCHAFPPANYRANGTVSSVNDRFMSTYKLRSGESETSGRPTRDPRCHYNKFPLQSKATKDECVGNDMSRDKLRSGNSEISMELARRPWGHYNNFPLQSTATKDECSGNDRFLSRDKLRSGDSGISMELTRVRRGHFNNFPLQSTATKDECSVNDRFLSTDKLRSGESEIPTELTRGPRGHYGNFPQQSSATKDGFAITICRDRYNLSDFQTEYETAKFYIIKSFNEDDIHKSIKYDVWTSTWNGNKKLNEAFHDAEAISTQTGKKCPIFLFFSVNASMQFVGVSEMVGPVDYKKDMKFWKVDKYNGFFPSRWHIIKDVPNRQLCHIILENNDNRSVTYTRDTQEIGLKQGLEMLNIFKSYPAKTSLLDDYDFYEKREKILRSEKSSKHIIREPKAYGYENYQYQNTVEARQERVTKQVPLVNLTRNLSLNPSGKHSFR